MPLVENSAEVPLLGPHCPGQIQMLDPDRVTYADFIAYAESHAGKFEFVDGQIISQAKPTKRHQRLSLALGNLLTGHVQPQGCDVLLDTTLALSDVRDDERAPDLMVTCDSADLSDDEVRKVRRPKLVIEILSERTAADDLGTKLLEYQAIVAIREYLVIDSRKRWAVLYIRDPQELFVAPRDFIAGFVTLASINYALDLDALYERARIGRGTAAPDS
jgi:Uma2 family endonuclease